MLDLSNHDVVHNRASSRADLGMKWLCHITLFVTTYFVTSVPLLTWFNHLRGTIMGWDYVQVAGQGVKDYVSSQKKGHFWPCPLGLTIEYKPDS